jgi:broad specificity phosphatase PhoE
MSVVNSSKEKMTMNNISADIQVWFLRHGKTHFDYENSNYDDFIEMLCNGHKTPLAEDHGIDFESLPKQVDLVCHSPLIRAFQTAGELALELDLKSMQELELLQEVRFDWDIIERWEYKSLAESRKVILQRWFDGKNKAETFEDSLTRVREIETFLSERQERTIILITHGWFLRLLEVYFVQGKHTGITLEDILAVRPVPLGHCFKTQLRARIALNRV